MPYGHQPICYIGEVGPAAAVSRDIPNLGPRISIVDQGSNSAARQFPSRDSWSIVKR
jgi:hypothetical protein